jgi:copper chaperone NosL
MEGGLRRREENEKNADSGEKMRGPNNKLCYAIVAVIVISLFVAPLLCGAEGKPPKPTSKDKCPVCGMFVEKYPDFITEIAFRDGSVAFFDGAKDMFKYYLNMNKYNPRQKETDIEYVYVTDYYSLTLVDGLKAYYVQGSDVFGPMGRELIPFEKEREAREFLKDHKGKALLRFREITGPIIKGLD